MTLHCHCTCSLNISANFRIFLLDICPRDTLRCFDHRRLGISVLWIDYFLYLRVNICSLVFFSTSCSSSGACPLAILERHGLSNLNCSDKGWILRGNPHWISISRMRKTHLRFVHSKYDTIFRTVLKCVGTKTICVSHFLEMILFEETFVARSFVICFCSYYTDSIYQLKYTLRKRSSSQKYPGKGWDAQMSLFHIL